MKRRRRAGQEHQKLSLWGMAGLAFFATVFIGGLVVTNWSRPEILETQSVISVENPKVERSAVPPIAAQPIEATKARSSHAQDGGMRFEICGSERVTCVVDGDTFWLEGTKIRIADIDTPEISQPSCASEKALGDTATLRLVELLNEGPFELFNIGDRDEDQYGRKLRVVMRAGVSLGDQLVSEGLARTWTGRREPWC